MVFRLLVVIALLGVSWPSFAKGVYLSADEFLARAFPQRGEQANVLWLSKEIKHTAEQILNHRYQGLRVRYWANGNRTAWIFNEIGKELPITIGVVVDDARIDSVEILEFRESRGGEVRYPFFTDQFHGINLGADKQLSTTIDGISGATLSVRAVTRVSRLGLYLHQKISTSLSSVNHK